MFLWFYPPSAKTETKDTYKIPWWLYVNRGHFYFGQRGHPDFGFGGQINLGPRGHPRLGFPLTREERIRKQEKRYIDLESRVIRYIGDTMSPYTTDTGMSKLIELSCEVFHMKLAPDFQKYDALKVSDELSTMDLMHFGWSMAKPFRKPCGHTALFLKQIFPYVFRNTEVFTIEKKLCLSPMQGRIKINRNVDKYGMAESIVDTHTTVKTSKKIKTKAKCAAKQAALSDMLEDGISDGFDLEGTLIED